MYCQTDIKTYPNPTYHILTKSELEPAKRCGMNTLPTGLQKVRKQIFVYTRQ